MFISQYSDILLLLKHCLSTGAALSGAIVESLKGICAPIYKMEYITDQNFFLSSCFA